LTRVAAIRGQTRTIAAWMQQWIDEMPPPPEMPADGPPEPQPPGDTDPIALRWPRRSPVRWLAALGLTAVASLGIYLAGLRLSPVEIERVLGWMGL
jgi:hypothetical protein